MRRWRVWEPWPACGDSAVSQRLTPQHGVAAYTPACGVKRSTDLHGGGDGATPPALTGRVRAGRAVSMLADCIATPRRRPSSSSSSPRHAVPAQACCTTPALREPAADMPNTLKSSVADPTQPARAPLATRTGELDGLVGRDALSPIGFACPPNTTGRRWRRPLSIAVPQSG